MGVHDAKARCPCADIQARLFLRAWYAGQSVPYCFRTESFDILSKFNGRLPAVLQHHAHGADAYALTLGDLPGGAGFGFYVHCNFSPRFGYYRSYSRSPISRFPWPDEYPLRRAMCVLTYGFPHVSVLAHPASRKEKPMVSCSEYRARPVSGVLSPVPGFIAQVPIVRISSQASRKKWACLNFF